MTRAKAFQLGLTALISFLIGTGSAISYGWRPTLIAAVLLVLAGLAIRALRRGNRQAAQIFDDELDDPDPFNERLIPKRHKPTDTTGEPR